MSKYNWINEDIKIDFPLPNVIKNLIHKLEELDKSKNYAYFNYSESLDYIAKELTFNGTLSKHQWDVLITKYNGG